VLPTVEQVHQARKQFPRWRVDAQAQQHFLALRGDDLRVRSTAPLESSRFMYLLSRRSRREVMAAACGSRSRRGSP